MRWKHKKEKVLSGTERKEKHNNSQASNGKLPKKKTFEAEATHSTLLGKLGTTNRINTAEYNSQFTSPNPFSLFVQ